jgi:hypothetical protein
LLAIAPHCFRRLQREAMLERVPRPRAIDSDRSLAQRVLINSNRLLEKRGTQTTITFSVLNDPNISQARRRRVEHGARTTLFMISLVTLGSTAPTPGKIF